MTPNTRSTFTARLQQEDIYSGGQPSQKSIMDPTLSFFIDTSNWAIRNTLCVTADERERNNLQARSLSANLVPNWKATFSNTKLTGQPATWFSGRNPLQQQQKGSANIPKHLIKVSASFLENSLDLCCYLHVLSLINMLNQTINYLMFLNVDDQDLSKSWNLDF